MISWFKWFTWGPARAVPYLAIALIGVSVAPLGPFSRGFLVGVVTVAIASTIFDQVLGTNGGAIIRWFVIPAIGMAAFVAVTWSILEFVGIQTGLFYGMCLDQFLLRLGDRFREPSEE